ncbi:MAG: alpha,alpha-trehalase TreF [Chitinophagaceae bacterium]|nr:MAG: alpha,alpha-trehalase TreF [Chitinophagaceae bacterium]
MMDHYEQYQLFRDVQMEKIFPDGKTFVDCHAKQPMETLDKLYLAEKDRAGFSLEEFVRDHFIVPVPMQQDYVLKEGSTVREHIEALWAKLVRPGIQGAGSKIALPYTYVVPGGRFGEMYYWDTYFTMLGLQVSRRTDVLQGIIDNFSHLIDTIGYIPNGTRDYFIGRSQPPYYSLMLRLLAEENGEEVLVKYLPQLEKEYLFWMKGVKELTPTQAASLHVVRMKGGELLNRYWDENETPRPESYREDVEMADGLAGQNEADKRLLYRNLRAGAESGWDFSSRWFDDVSSFNTIRTVDIIPVDLNCLLWHLEQTLSDAYSLAGNVQEKARYELLALNRKSAIDRYLWDELKGFYFDYDIVKKYSTGQFTIAAATPLFFGLSSGEQARLVSMVIEEQFLVAGGLLTTLHETGQQWDAPNGWAPLQWIAIRGLEKYGFNALSGTIARRWVKLNTEVFERTGKLMEKYNVVDAGLDAGGGEYEGQDGFGWTNGVLLKLLETYPVNSLPAGDPG